MYSETVETIKQIIKDGREPTLIQLGIAIGELMDEIEKTRKLQTKKGTPE
jgi:hypothetical protein